MRIASTALVFCCRRFLLSVLIAWATVTAHAQTSSPRIDLVTQFGHTTEVTAAAFSPDGHFAATGDAEGVVIVWEVEGGRKLRQLQLTAPALAVAFPPSGLAVWTADSTGARRWDLLTMAATDSLALPGETTGMVALPDGRQLLTAGADGVARVWNAVTGAAVSSFRVEEGPAEIVDSGVLHGVWAASVVRLDRDPYSYHIPRRDTIRVWELATQRLISVVPAENMAGRPFFCGDNLCLPQWGSSNEDSLWVRRVHLDRQVGVGERLRIPVEKPGGGGWLRPLPPGHLWLVSGTRGDQASEDSVSSEPYYSGTCLWDSVNEEDIVCSESGSSLGGGPSWGGWWEYIDGSRPVDLSVAAFSLTANIALLGYTTGATALVAFSDRPGGQPSVRWLARPPDRPLRVVFLDDRAVLLGRDLRDLATWRTLGHLATEPMLSLYRDPFLSADGRHLVALWERTMEGSTQVWALPSGDAVALVPTDGSAPSVTVISDDGQYLLTECGESASPRACLPRGGSPADSSWATLGVVDLSTGEIGGVVVRDSTITDVLNALSAFGGRVDSSYAVVGGCQQDWPNLDEFVAAWSDACLGDHWEGAAWDWRSGTKAYSARIRTARGERSTRTRSERASLAERPGGAFLARALEDMATHSFPDAGTQIEVEASNGATFEWTTPARPVQGGARSRGDAAARPTVGADGVSREWDATGRPVLVADASPERVAGSTVLLDQQDEQLAAYPAGTWFVGDGRLLAVPIVADEVLARSAVRLVEARSGKEQARIALTSDGEWVAWTPDGRFDVAEPERPPAAHWIIATDTLRLVPVEAFMRENYEPGLVARVLRGDPAPPSQRMANRDLEAPSASVASVEPDPVDPNRVWVRVRADPGAHDLRLLRDGRAVGWTDGRVQIDTSFVVALAGADSRRAGWHAEIEAVAQAAETLTDTSDCVRLPTYGLVCDPLQVVGLVEAYWPDFTDSLAARRYAYDDVGPAVAYAGEFAGRAARRVEFSVYTFNADGVKGHTVSYEYVPAAPLPRRRGRAYLVALGVDASSAGTDLALYHAVDDARATLGTLSTLLRARALADTTAPDEVVTIPLLAAHDTTASTVATKAALRAVLRALAGDPLSAEDRALLGALPGGDRLREATPDDLVILAASTHGVAGQDGAFYLFAQDAGPPGLDLEDRLTHAITADTLAAWLRGVDAGEMALVVDACHSAAAVRGGDFLPGPFGGRGLGQLAYDRGMRVLVASQEGEAAIESASLGHGVLTHALVVEGLGEGRADLDGDGGVTLDEWLRYGEARVPEVQVARDVAKGLDVPRARRQAASQRPALFDFTRGRGRATRLR